MTKSNWLTKSIKDIYTGKFLKLKVEQVQTPEGRQAQYEIIERKDISIIVPVSDDSFYMVQQFRYPAHVNSLEFPQGFIEENEEIDQGALRELQEETGFSAEKVSLLGSLWVSSGFLRQKAHVFIAEGLNQGEQKLDTSEEGLHCQKISLQQISSKVSNGEISNAPTVAAIGLYLLQINKNKSDI